MALQEGAYVEWRDAANTYHWGRYQFTDRGGDRVIIDTMGTQHRVPEAVELTIQTTLEVDPRSGPLSKGHLYRDAEGDLFEITRHEHILVKVDGEWRHGIAYTRASDNPGRPTFVCTQAEFRQQFTREEA